MCLILFAHRLRADRPLVLLANRDEFLARPTAPLAPWPDYPGVLAGRDLTAGGTWFGLAPGGRWAAVTNIREGEKSAPGGPSRGHLVRDYLAGTAPPLRFARELVPRCAAYAGFNLLLGAGDELCYLNNREAKPVLLPPGLYGLSNGRLDSPWPKVRRGKTALAAVLADGRPTPEQGFRLLADPTTFPGHELPATGIPPEWEKALSATFIVTPGYGTRSSTVLLCTANGRRWVGERTFVGEPSCWTQRSYRLAAETGMVA